MNKLKNKSGITLIALVVTIIVLLILAGISIAMLTGDNGILNRAGEAKENTDIAQIEEQITLATGGALARGLGTINYDNLVTELNDQFGANGYTISPNVTDDGDSARVATEWDVAVETSSGTVTRTITSNGNVERTLPTVDASKLAVGDYISNYPVYYNNVATYNNGYTPEDKYASNWRVLSTEGGTVKLVSAGVPLTFYHPYETNGAAASVTALTTDFFETSFNDSGRGYRACGFLTEEGGTAVTTIARVKTLFNNQYTAMTETGNSAVPTVEAMRRQEWKEIFAIRCKDNTSKYAVTIFATAYNNNSSGTGMEVMHYEGFGCWGLDNNENNYEAGVRPVVTLKSTVKFVEDTNKINDTNTWELK